MDVATDRTFKIGVDEVGRGCLFGPLVVVAVVNTLRWSHPDVRDSKKISSEQKRHKLAALIKQHTTWHVGVTHADAINELGMKRCISDTFAKTIGELLKRLGRISDYCYQIILDGDRMGVGRLDHFVDPPMVTLKFVPKADVSVFEVSAASLVAKSLRDTWCHDIVKERPTLQLYGIDTNKGYASEAHTLAILRHGRTIHHRNEFVDSLLANRKAKAKR